MRAVAPFAFVAFFCGITVALALATFASLLAAASYAVLPSSAAKA